MSDKLLYTIPEAALALVVSEKTVRRLISEGTLATVKVTRRLIRIPAASLLAVAGASQTEHQS